MFAFRIPDGASVGHSVDALFVSSAVREQSSLLAKCDEPTGLLSDCFVKMRRAGASCLATSASVGAPYSITEDGAFTGLTPRPRPSPSNELIQIPLAAEMVSV
jgi:hypothetical protein